MSLADHHAISSGLEAIVFTPIYETGSDLATRAPVLIEADRLVSAGDEPCRVLVGGVSSIYFSSTNVTDRTLTIPLTFAELNSMYSVTGQAVPAESFAPGTSGFTVSERHFIGPSSTLVGVWRFLGQEITVPAQPPVCTARGIPGVCEELDKTVLQLPFNHTRLTVIRLTKAALAAAKSGRWKGSHGNFAVPFLIRGSRVLTLIEALMRNQAGRTFTCTTTPNTCTAYKVPKKALRLAFRKIFVGPVPRGLEHVAARLKVELKAFDKMLKKVPDTYVTCP